MRSLTFSIGRDHEREKAEKIGSSGLKREGWPVLITSHPVSQPRWTRAKGALLVACVTHR
jgi:hypothetical protein